MRRPRKPMPLTLIDLAFNAAKGYYEIEEDGITYLMQLEEVRLIREYFRYFAPGGGMLYPTVSRWYKDLDKSTKKKVSRTGNLPADSDGFYPDHSPTEE